MKVRLTKIAVLILVFVGYGLVGVLAHEAGHLITNNVLGGTGNIFYDYTLGSGHMNWVTLPKNHIWLVYMGGGIFAAFFMFLFFWLPARLTPSKQDVYIEGMVAGQIIANLFQAAAELILYYWGISLFEWLRIIAYLAAAIIFCLLYVVKLIKWVDRPNNHCENHCKK